MKPRRFQFPGDFLLNLMAGGLAFACTAFAGSMIMRMEHAGQPVARAYGGFASGTSEDFADPEITGAISRAAPAASRGKPPEAAGFRLLAVIGRIAYVEVTGPSGREIWPVAEGGMLPGAGRVLHIGHDGGRWQVIAARLVIGGGAQ